MLSGLQPQQRCCCDTAVVQVGVIEAQLLSAGKFCFVTPNTAGKPRFPQLLLLFRASIALQQLISDSMNKCRGTLW